LRCIAGFQNEIVLIGEKKVRLFQLGEMPQLEEHPGTMQIGSDP
jgi:hypothetical protein